MEFGDIAQHGNATMKNIALDHVTELPADARNGSFILFNKKVFICVEIANNFPIWVGLTDELGYAQFEQETLAMDWVFTHELNAPRPIIQAYDENGNVINPSNIDTSVRGRVVLSFPSPRKGMVVAVAGNTFGTPAVDISKTKDFTAATEVEFIHGLGYNPIVQVIVDNQLYAPQFVTFPTTNSIVVTFETAKTGSIRVS